MRSMGGKVGRLVLARERQRERESDRETGTERERERERERQRERLGGTPPAGAKSPRTL